MSTDKEITIQFLKEDNPELYKSLKEAGDLERLSEDELLHIHASSATEFVDVSDVKDSDVEPVNMDVIANVMKEAKRFNATLEKKATPSFFLISRKMAVAAAVVLCLGITLWLSSSSSNVHFTDFTSQETTDYAVRMKGSDDSCNIFQEELVTTVIDIVSENCNGVGEVNCSLSAVADRGDVVILTVSTESKKSSIKIELTNKDDVEAFLKNAIPKAIGDLK